MYLGYINFLNMLNLKKSLLTRYPRTLARRKYHKEILPRSDRKIYPPNSNRPYLNIGSSKQLPLSKTQRSNEIGIQMLSKKIYDQVFIEEDQRHPRDIEECKRELAKHQMVSKCEDFSDDVDFKIPPLEGKNIEEHFEKIARRQVDPYRNLVTELLRGIPEPPGIWKMQLGWTRYKPGCDPEPVDYPLESAFVFDVEVCMSSGKTPTLATAVSSEAWYSWVSPSLLEGSSKPVTNHQYPIDSLIPIESRPGDDKFNLTEYQLKPKVVIGHNVSYDRARIKEQYWLNKTGTRFIDTMSLHVCVGGLTSYQRAVLKSKKFIAEDEDWKDSSSLNSLVDCYKLYCGEVLKKDTRDVFVEGTLKDVQNNFQEVMRYCSSDVMATYKILKQLFPLFQERFPHPATLAGMLELSTAYLPVNSNWQRYLEESEQAYDDLQNEAKILLARRADQACQLLHDDKYREDLWMWDQDWTVKDIKLKKRNKLETRNKLDSEELEEVDVLREKFNYLWDSKKNLPSSGGFLCGYPAWYKKLCTKPDSDPSWVPGPHLISTSMRITPKLLCLTWEGYPLHHLKDKGWGFLVPFAADVETILPLKKLLEKCPLLQLKSGDSSREAMQHISKSVQEDISKRQFYSRKKLTEDVPYKGTGIWCDTEIENCCWFFKLPHKDGASRNVGNPLAKDFLIKFSENVLAGDTEVAEQVLEIARKVSYWKNNRDRIMDQMVVWLNEENLPGGLRDTGQDYGAIVPQVVVCGTLTRRAVEPTWMTASNADPERIGSELRAMVQAPPGYNIVGADVDSQELWIASVLGDAHRAGVHGATPFGWMTLSGNKTAGTDMHSVTAKAVGISRDHAKVINYARIYGAGQTFAERLLKQFNPTMSETEARSKAQKMFALTKGKKSYYLNPEHLTEFADRPYTAWQAGDIAKKHGKTVGEMFSKSGWCGGTESAMFNRLEEIANSSTPRTPFLGGRLSRAIEGKSTDNDRNLPTRVNWVVQSGAADFLHLMLVCMRWLLGDKVRFCLSFHDEVRYLVPESYKYRAALALHVTNLLTRAFCSYRLGMHDLPQSVAFFSSVEVDRVLRKESKQDCVTPSNPHGLRKGYNIQNGESLDVYQAVEKAGGKNGWWWCESEKRKCFKDV